MNTNNIINKAVIIIARNEGNWTSVTADDFKKHMPDAEIIGIDDGEDNTWPDYVKVIKTKGGIGVGRVRRLGAESTSAELLVFTDGHVKYKEGDIDKAWDLASKGYVVNPSVVSMESESKKGCGRRHLLDNHSAKYVSAKEGMQCGLVGSVYFMRKDVALDIVAPTPSHGYNEQIMTYAAFSFGHKIYALPSLSFSHLFKKKFNYKVTFRGQQKNLLLLKWWFFGGRIPPNVSGTESNYMKYVRTNKKITIKQLKESINQMNKILTNGSN